MGSLTKISMVYTRRAWLSVYDTLTKAWKAWRGVCWQANHTCRKRRVSAGAGKCCETYLTSFRTWEACIIAPETRTQEEACRCAGAGSVVAGAG